MRKHKHANGKVGGLDAVFLGEGEEQECLPAPESRLDIVSGAILELFHLQSSSILSAISQDGSAMLRGGDAAGDDAADEGARPAVFRTGEGVLGADIDPFTKAALGDTDRLASRFERTDAFR
ncbi:hypothetical protein PC9H_008284 [Pleurotus ostreatus]|uniref:Uncharacterized protein n=1 Tax=Pleurotus ostreatus TaxID=5322 RepID=A0A8H6ZRF7_PLEOS|nr:uncharacterized protein PC9H_008284 [Pleurotus ostreatus]KAF7425922.1 hypothetical protein PC9H_008284 [Pleurotus ostreatus]